MMMGWLSFLSKKCYTIICEKPATHQTFPHHEKLSTAHGDEDGVSVHRFACKCFYVSPRTRNNAEHRVFCYYFKLQHLTSIHYKNEHRMWPLLSSATSSSLGSSFILFLSLISVSQWESMTQPRHHFFPFSYSGCFGQTCHDNIFNRLDFLRVSFFWAFKTDSVVSLSRLTNVLPDVIEGFVCSEKDTWSSRKGKLNLPTQE